MRARIASALRNTDVSRIEEYNSEIRQSGRLSTHKILLDDIIQIRSVRTNKLKVGHLNLKRTNVSEEAFVDDVVLISGSKKNGKNRKTFGTRYWKRKD